MDWARSIIEWTTPRLVDLPAGISRHAVRFVALERGTFAVKELPRQAGQRDYDVLQELEARGGPSVRPVGLVIRGGEDPGSERAACLITRYVDYSFSYRELLSGRDFGPRRQQLLDAFALLLAQLHLLGCLWADCSLSNVLYRFDAGTIDPRANKTLTVTKPGTVAPSSLTGATDQNAGRATRNTRALIFRTRLSF